MNKFLMAEAAEGSLLGGSGGKPDPAKAGEPVVAPVYEGVEFLKDVAPEFRDDPSLQAFKDLPGLAKSYVHLVKKFGQDKFTVPGKNATPGEWEDVFKKLGKPATVTDYKVAAPKGVEVDEKFLGEYAKHAFENNLLPGQAEKLLAWYSGQHATLSKGMEEVEIAKRTQELDGLRKEWGAGFDRKVEAARFALKEFGDDEVRQHLDSLGLGDDAKIIKFLAKVGEGMSEKGFAGADVAKGGLTPDEAKAEMTSIMSDLKGPYYDKLDLRHQDSVKRVNELMKFLG